MRNMYHSFVLFGALMFGIGIVNTMSIVTPATANEEACKCPKDCTCEHCEGMPVKCECKH